MGRDVRRVPFDFDWPLNKIWTGYFMPEHLKEKECEACGGRGYSPEGERLHGQWYGNAPFDPEETGSTPVTAETPEVRAFAERNVGSAPAFYGDGERAIVREAQRLAKLWNASWSHHLAQEDVDALIEGGRLMDFTHRRDPEARRWQAIEPRPTITAEQVNRWSLGGFGHDSINCWIAVEAKCKRLGVPYRCAECDGHGSTPRWTGQREEAEAWEEVEPPAGEGWQMWETTSEGSPISPVFTTPEELAQWLADSGASWFGDTPATRDQWLGVIVGTDFAHVQIAPGVVIM